MRVRFALLIGLVLGGLISGATVVLAGSGTPPATAGSTLAQAAINVTGSKNKVCMLAFDTRTDYLDLPGQATTVVAVQVKKPCAGPAIGSFTADTVVAPGGAISISAMKATCVATGGLNNPCTVGQATNALLGGNALRWGSGDWETHGVDLVWPDLKRGVWLFELQLFGRDAYVDSLSTRTFTVTG